VFCVGVIYLKAEYNFVNFPLKGYGKTGELLSASTSLTCSADFRSIFLGIETNTNIPSHYPGEYSSTHVGCYSKYFCDFHCSTRYLFIMMANRGTYAAKNKKSYKNM